MSNSITTEEVAQRLTSFAYIVTPEDSIDLAFAVERATLAILNDCNIAELPERLKPTAIDMAAGLFLYARKQSGKLNIEGLNLEAIKSVAEGDTTVNFTESDTQAQRFDKLLSSMLHPTGLARFRRLVW